MDPRAKLIVLLAYGVCVAMTPSRDAVGLAELAGALAAAMVAFKVRALTVIIRLLPLAGLAIAALLGAMLGGSAREGLGLVVRLALVSGAMLAVTLTTPYTALVAALGGLRIPAVVISVLLLTGRYMYVLGDEALRASRAWRSRAVGPMNVRQAASLGRLAMGLIRRAVDRSERIAWAMVARGFDGALRARPLPRMTMTDAMLAAGAVALLAGLAMSRR
jgi:cobalt/nickel transport system permease protein